VALLPADLQRALGYVRRQAWRLVPVVALTLLATALSLAQPFLSKVLVDRALLGRDVRLLAWTVLGFLGLTAITLACNTIAGLRYTRVSADILFEMRLEVLAHLQQLSPRYFTATPIGQIASRINSDIAEIQRVVSEVALAWIGQVVFLVGSVAMLLVLDARLFLVSLLAFPPALWSLVRYRRRLEGAVTQVREQSAGVGTFLIEALQGMRLLVAHNAQGRSRDEFARRNDGFVSALMSMRRLTYLAGGLPGALLAVGSAGVFFYGGSRVISGEISMGTLVAFVAYQMRLLSPVQGLMGIYTSVAAARVSLRRVQEILDTPVAVPDRAVASPVPTVRGEVEVRGVTYQYDRGEVLRDVSFRVNAREWVAIVGVSGGGKSSLADLLVRHADPMVGSILLDGHDLRNFPLATLRDHVLVVDGEPFVLHASVAENLRIAAPHASDAEVVDALQRAGLGGWLAAAPEGLHTVLGERGRALSSGERQRVAIARAILASPRVLILDEATGALDVATEGTLLETLRPWLAERTVVCITHRPAVAALASRVIMLREGRVVADEGVVS
jgi:ATP-binding cassette subfamily B protein